MNETQVETRLCPECDLMVDLPELYERQEARCPRCRHVLERHFPVSVQTLLALVLTGLLFYFPANLYPILTLELLGQENSSSILDGIKALWNNQLEVVSVLVFVSAILVPLVRLLILLPVLMAAHTGRLLIYAQRWFRSYVQLYEWGMVEIYMLGALVAIIKLADMATVQVGIGLFCYTVLMLVEITISLKLNEHEIWRRLDNNV